MDLAAIETELASVTASISKLYTNNNLGVRKIEIQTPNGKTIVEQANFVQVLNALRARKQELEQMRNALLGIQSSIVDASLPSRAIPIVFSGGF